MSETKTSNIVLAGVGGQGILLASEIAARTAMNAGYQVKTNEIHGMAQRGGSVIAQIRYGKEVNSPLIAERSADVLGAIEKIEAIRFAHYLKPDGLAVVSSQTIVPVTVSTGAATYPEDVKDRLNEVFSNLIYVDAAKIAVELGNIRAANVVVLGALSTGINLPDESWKEAISKAVKPQFVDMNIKAFEQGRGLANEG